ELPPLVGHQGPVRVLSFSRDGRVLVSGSDDTTALVWDLRARGHLAQRPEEPLTADDLSTLWAELGDTDAKKAFRAIVRSAAAPTAAVPFLDRRLRPVEPADPRRVAQIVKDLGSDQFALRQRATRQLVQLGEPALPALRQTLAAQPTLEVRRRLEQVIEKLQPEARSTEVRRAWRAVEVLEWSGSPAAQQVLERLARGVAEARQTQAARSALDRLAARSQ